MYGVALVVCNTKTQPFHVTRTTFFNMVINRYESTSSSGDSILGTANRDIFLALATNGKHHEPIASFEKGLAINSKMNNNEGYYDKELHKPHKPHNRAQEALLHHVF